MTTEIDDPSSPWLDRLTRGRERLLACRLRLVEYDAWAWQSVLVNTVLSEDSERGGPYRTPQSPVSFDSAWRRYRWLRRASVAVVVVAPTVPVVAFFLSPDLAAIIAALELVLLVVLIVRGTFSCPACGAVMARATPRYERVLPTNCWRCGIGVGQRARPSALAHDPIGVVPKWLMRPRLALRLWAWLAVTGAGWPALLGGDLGLEKLALPPRECSALACESGVHVSGPVPPDVDAVEVDVCLDDRCAKGRITQLNIAPPRGPHVAETTAEPLAIGGHPTRTDDMLHFDVVRYARIPHFEEAKVRVTTETGQVLVDEVFPLEWWTSAPNGRRCGPVCDHADVTYGPTLGVHPGGTVDRAPE